MKVLMLGWEFPPFCSGGLGTHCYHLTKNLSALGTSIRFLMPKSAYPVSCDFLDLVQVEPMMPDGPYFSEKPISKSYGKNFLEEVYEYNRQCLRYALQKDFDVIHCHDWLTSMAGVEIKRKTGKPLIISIHSTEYDRTGGHSVHRWIHDREAEAISEADRIITVSQMMKNQLVSKYAADPEKIDVVYNAIDCSGWKAEKQRVFNDKKVVLFMGRITIQKGPDFFLKAAKKVLEKRKDVVFVIGGKGDMMPQIINEAVALGISDNVMFLGYVPDEDLPRLYASADTFVLSSVSEPFGITVLEAIVSDTPVIMTKQSGVREVVKHAFAVDFWDVDEMANKILALLTYSPLHSTMRKNGKREVESQTWDKIARQTLDNVYRRAAG